jgi:hypothetical protein
MKNLASPACVLDLGIGVEIRIASDAEKNDHIKFDVSESGSQKFEGGDSAAQSRPRCGHLDWRHCHLQRLVVSSGGKLAAL